MDHLSEIAAIGAAAGGADGEPLPTWMKWALVGLLIVISVGGVAAMVFA